MNLYQVNYIDNEGNGLVANFTERNENAVRKSFKSEYKGATLENIGLIREGVSATKEQERDTLAAIRQMVEELGPVSYLSTAFAGCFEDAEQNIEYDAAFSMKDRYEYEQSKCQAAEEKSSGLLKEIEALQKSRNELLASMNALSAKTLSADDMTDCRALIREYIYEKETALAAAAEIIVKFAENPASPEFAESVRNHRNLASSLEYYKALDDRMEAVIKAGA